MNIRPGKYVWKTKHHDQPVTVVRTLGTGPDGRVYVEIAGTTTGVPADELQPVRISTRELFRKFFGI